MAGAPFPGVDTCRSGAHIRRVHIAVLDAHNLGDDLDLSIFGAFGSLEILHLRDSGDVPPVLDRADCVVVNRLRLSSKLLADAKRLELVCLTSTGTDQIDLEGARDAGIAVASVPAYATESVAQHTFALALCLLEQLPYYDAFVRRADFSDGFTVFHRPFFELAGSTWGIVGLGAIGTRVAELATAFGCRVLHYSPRPDAGAGSRHGYPRVSLDTILSESDVLSIHAPIADATKGLFGYEELSRMKPTAILVNVGRGGIVVEEDLAQALNEGLLGGAALDVFSPEPPEPGNPLLHIHEPSRLLLSPHIAWAGIQARRRLVEEVAKNIEAYRAGGRRNRVD